MNYDSFMQWLRRARRGSRFTYHVGHLVSDKGPDERRFKTEKQQEVCKVAATAWEAYRGGQVTLVQARVVSVNERPDDFAYVAERR